MLKVVALSTLEELETIRDFWSRTVVYPTADFELFLHICQSRKQIVGPHVFAVIDCEQVVSLFIGRIEIVQRISRLGYLKFKGPKLRSLTFIYGGNVGEWGSDYVLIFLRTVENILERREVDVVHFAFLQEDTILVQCLRESSKSHKYTYHYTIPQKHWKMQLPNSGRDYLEHLSRKSRYNIRRERRMFDQVFGSTVKFRLFQKPEDLDECIRDIEYIASRSYHRSIGVGFSQNEETLKRMKIEAKRGRLLVYILYKGEFAVAFWVGVNSNRVLHTDYTGYLAEYAQHEPGKIALLSLIDYISSKDLVQAVDFGFGDAFYKRQLGSESWDELSITLFGRSFRGICASSIERALAVVEQRLRDLVASMKLFDTIKKKWRNQLKR